MAITFGDHLAITLECSRAPGARRARWGNPLKPADYSPAEDVFDSAEPAIPIARADDWRTASAAAGLRRRVGHGMPASVGAAGNGAPFAAPIDGGDAIRARQREPPAPGLGRPTRARCPARRLLCDWTKGMAHS